MDLERFLVLQHPGRPETFSAEKLLRVNGLKTQFFTERGVVRAVDGVSFTLARGETMGLVGETGCGKSVTALSILRLIAYPPGRIAEGEVFFEGRDLLRMSDDQIRRIRGNRIAMIFQEPMTALNPVFSAGDQISEVIALHQRVGRRETRKRALEMLRLVRIPDPDETLKKYPHELSGGMQQRVMIAMALSCNPDVLIADEPTTALDVTIQAQILNLMRELRSEFQAAILLITHDLGVIAELCDRVAVMYAGKIVESADVNSIFHSPAHPYTMGLLGAVRSLSTVGDKELKVIPGNLPSPVDLPEGCRFEARCERREFSCSTKEPQLVEMGKGHCVACHLA